MTAYLLNLARRGAGRLHAVGQEHPRSAAAPAQPQRRDDATTRCGPATSSAASAKPDVVATACMTNCEVEPKVASMLPDFALNAHGNLAQQNRMVGPQRGVDTGAPARRGSTEKRHDRRRRPPQPAPAASRAGRGRTGRPGRPGADAKEQLRRLPRDRPQGGRAELVRHREEARRQGRLPRRQDPLRRIGRVGRDPDAAADPDAMRKPGASRAGSPPAPAPEVQGYPRCDRPGAIDRIQVISAPT